MPKFAELADRDDDTLVLPIRGREFTVRPVTAEQWLYLQRLLAKLRGEDTDEDFGPAETLHRNALGEPAYTEMLTYVTRDELQVAAMTAMFWQTGNTAGAELYWATGGKAQSPSESDGTDASTPAPQAAAAGGRQTRSRASTAATTKRPAKTAAARRGRTSSTAGD